MTEQAQEPQSGEGATAEHLTTGERLATTGRAVAQGMLHQIRGDHEMNPGVTETVDPKEVERILDGWPEPQRNVAEQLLEKYGRPNEATLTNLFWYENKPWKRTVLSRDVVVHHWPTLHTDFLTQYIDYPVPREGLRRSRASTAASLWTARGAK